MITLEEVVEKIIETKSKIKQLQRDMANFDKSTITYIVLNEKVVRLEAEISYFYEEYEIIEKIRR